MTENLNSNTEKLTQNIKDKARSLGFQLVGVTSPEPPAHLNVYNEWIASGKHADMAYLASERAVLRRSNPLVILPECQSILILGMSYFPRVSHKINKTPKIATYALGLDYHDVLVQRLEDLVEHLSDLAGRPISYRIYTDTGPILEREFAQRAGLGWIGKNTCLIHPRMGSYFFLGEILLNIKLELDEPFPADYCGSCTRCIEACPTGCILPNRTLDARRCISYLTIEHRNAFHHNLRPLIGDWIFGCDVCQEVCPWNKRFAHPTEEQAFKPIPFHTPPSLEKFLSLTAETFPTNLRGSPLKRAKLQGILRNATVVAGNTSDADLTPLLARLCEHPDPNVRSHTVWALGKIGGSEAIFLLEKHLEKELNPKVLEEISMALRNARIIR